MRQAAVIRALMPCAVALWVVGAALPRAVVYEHTHEHAGPHVHAWGAHPADHAHPADDWPHVHGGDHHPPDHVHAHDGEASDHAATPPTERPASARDGSASVAWLAASGTTHRHHQPPLPLQAFTPAAELRVVVRATAAVVAAVPEHGVSPTPHFVARGPPRTLSRPIHH